MTTKAIARTSSLSCSSLSCNRHPILWRGPKRRLNPRFLATGNVCRYINEKDEH